jgi:uncharacterized cupin superfamily protein
MVPEAPLEPTEHGLLLAGEGWFVLNAREAQWRRWEGMGKWPRLEGARAILPQLGVGLTVLEPGEPMAMYHWEADQEDFLVLSGEAIAIVEGQERPLRQWDFLHCPAGTNHVIVGAGDGPCVIFAVGSRENQTGAYTVNETALRHGVCVEEETNDANVAYARFPEPVTTRYRDGRLSG